MVLFLIADIFDDLKDFLDAGAGLAVAARYFFYRQPANLVNVLPMSILLSASFMMSILGRHHEISAIRAAGLSVLRFAMPVWIIALAFSAISFWLSEDVIPNFNHRAEWIIENLHDEGGQVERETSLAYRNNEAGRDWFFQHFQAANGVHSGILIKQFRPDRTVEWELRAERGYYRSGKWLFENGIFSTFDIRGEMPTGPQQVFQQKVMPGLSETPADIVNSLRPAEELPVRAIISLLRSSEGLPETSKDVLRTIISYRLSFPIACIIAALLGVALSAVQERSNTMRGFALSVGLMVSYYVISQLFVLLGKNGMVPPVLAGVLPTAAFVAWGCMAVYRNR